MNNKLYFKYMRKKFFTGVCTVAMLASCIKGEPLNQECDIVSAYLEGEQYATLFYQPSQMRQDDIPSTTKEIVFVIKSLELLPERLPVQFTLTPGATVQPASGSEQDFRKGPVNYVVTSEDGSWERRYSVSFKESSLPNTLFSFEHVTTETEANNNQYHHFYEVDAIGNRYDIWASGNPGAILIKRDSKPEDQPTYSMADGYQGKGVCLNTQDAGALGHMFNKPIAAGNLFMGEFLMENVLMNSMKATKFGTPITQVPVRVTGYYKYTPGENFTNADMEIVPGRVDEASIYAVFYRNKNENGEDVFLYGDDVLTSPYIVRKAEMATVPATDQWTKFEMFFEGSDADPKILADQGYNLTVVFSSSKEGATFEGAVGSTLCIDEVEVFFEALKK